MSVNNGDGSVVDLIDSHIRAKNTATDRTAASAHKIGDDIDHAVEH